METVRTLKRAIGANTALTELEGIGDQIPNLGDEATAYRIGYDGFQKEINRVDANSTPETHNSIPVHFRVTAGEDRTSAAVAPGT